MSNLISIYHSSVGKKFFVGFTGLFLCSFLIVHFFGNMLLFYPDGGARYQEFSDFMATNVLIRTVEIVLFAGFILHIVTSTILWMRNRKARPQKYAVNKPLENSSLPSRITFLTGSIIFIFLVVHMDSFWITSRFQEQSLIDKYETQQSALSETAQEEYQTDQSAETHRLPIMYMLVAERFANPLYDLFYLVALFLLGFHLRHGFQSAFQTFGIRGKRYEGLIEAVGVFFWLVIPLGFASMPIYFYLIS